MSADLDAFMQSGAYLPKPIRDFHDGKEVFKAMHSLVAVDKNEYAKGVSWVQGQCYVIDIFLWFMARRGWTLQRSRARLPFVSLEADLDTVRQQRTEEMKRYLNERKAAQSPQASTKEGA